MAENPLLPNAELRALRTATKRAGSLEARPSKSSSKGISPHVLPSGREALLAATLMQLLPGDTLVPEPSDSAALTLIAAEKLESSQTVSTLHFPAPDTFLLTAAGVAAAQKRSGNDKLVLAFAQSGLTNLTWANALTWAQTEDLPLIVAVADPSGPEAFRPPLSTEPNTLDWSSLTRLARKLHLPILSVDGEDAVAVYRVMQESVLRARSGAGPAVLWAVLPSAETLSKDRPSSATPLRRLERYMKTRSISF